ncbi:hypothetical protein OAO01_01985 [Oligoflexia bacterium]|nr:hypothetical protein [Oligoflexia bacterium]
MAEKQNQNTSKYYIKESLNYYAAFFAGVAEKSDEVAMESLTKIRSVDSQAEKRLNEQELKYYKNRRTQLMRLFRVRLVEDLKGQIEQEILDKAENLVKDFEL